MGGESLTLGERSAGPVGGRMNIERNCLMGGGLAGRGSGGKARYWWELLGNVGGQEMEVTGRHGQVLGGMPAYWGAIAGCWGA